MLRMFSGLAAAFLACGTPAEASLIDYPTGTDFVAQPGDVWRIDVGFHTLNLAIQDIACVINTAGCNFGTDPDLEAAGYYRYTAEWHVDRNQPTPYGYVATTSCGLTCSWEVGAAVFNCGMVSTTHCEFNIQYVVLRDFKGTFGINVIGNRSFTRLSPVPLPGALSLFATAIVVGGWFGHRRKA